MDASQEQETPSARTGMLIRRPVAQVFEAFVDPRITTRFWFSRSSGKLEVGKQAKWDWEMYDVSIPITVKAVDPNDRIVIEWPGDDGPTTVEWRFVAQEDGATFVTITNTGFTAEGRKLVRQVADATEGFTLVLAGAKAVLEHDLNLRLVEDRFPGGIQEQ